MIIQHYGIIYDVKTKKCVQGSQRKSDFIESRFEETEGTWDRFQEKELWRVKDIWNKK